MNNTVYNVINLLTVGRTPGTNFSDDGNSDLTAFSDLESFTKLNKTDRVLGKDLQHEKGLGKN